MAIKLLFLDLNGTVVDDWESSYAGVQAIFAHYNKPCPTIGEYIEQAAATGDYHSFYTNNCIRATRDELYAIYSPAYSEHAGEVVVMPHVGNVLRRLNCLGVEIHLLTAARKDFAEPLMLAAGIEDCCAGFHYHVHNKSAQIHAVIDGMVISQNECAMVGDLPSDVVHAKQAGIKSIAFLNRHVPQALFDDIHEIDCVTDSFLGLLEFIESCN